MKKSILIINEKSTYFSQLYGGKTTGLYLNRLKEKKLIILSNFPTTTTRKLLRENRK